jgi:hypothetical protein
VQIVSDFRQSLCQALEAVKELSFGFVMPHFCSYFVEFFADTLHVSAAKLASSEQKWHHNNFQKQFLNSFLEVVRKFSF